MSINVLRLLRSLALAGLEYGRRHHPRSVAVRTADASVGCFSAVVLVSL